MNTHAGYSKKTLTDTNVLLAGGGDKSLADFLGGIQYVSASNKIQYRAADTNTWTDLVTLVNSGDFVTSLAINGDLLRWVKNGANNDLTIPYATKAALDSNGRSLVTYKEYSGTFPPNDGTEQWYTILNYTNNYYSQSAILEINTRRASAVILITFYNTNTPYITCLSCYGSTSASAGGFSGKIRVIASGNNAIIQGAFYASTSTSSYRYLGLKVYSENPVRWSLPDTITADTATYDSLLANVTFRNGGFTAGHISNYADNTYNIGAAANRYKNVYATTFHGALQGNASTATKLATARTISLTGDATGSTAFDGSTDVSMSVSISDMTGATASAAGVAGFVPAPPSDGYNTKFLRADGTWVVPTGTTYNAGTLALYNAGTDTEDRVWSANVLKSIGDQYLLLSGGTMTGRIVRSGGGLWIKGRDKAVIFGSSYGQEAAYSWNTVWSLKTTNGAWTAGNLSGDDYLKFVYDTDADYNSNNNNATYTITFPLKSGTVAMTSDIPSGGGNYLPLSGGTMTGTINLRSNAYSGPSGTHGINCNNSDIVNVNSIYTSDLSDNWDEGLLFARTNGNWDSFWAANGNFYFSANSGASLATLNNDGLYLTGSNGWIRTYGTCGWYSQTHGGGWYMTDSTFIRTYNGKILHMNVNDNAYGACSHHLAADFYNPNHICIGLRNNNCSWYICSNNNRNMYIGYRPNGNVSGYSSDSYPVYVTPSGGIYTNSDRKLKKNISNIPESSLNDLFNISDKLFRSYTWKQTNKDSYGFIAQELEPWIPEAVSEDANGIKHVSYNVAYAKIIASLIYKIKDLENRIKQLEK